MKHTKQYNSTAKNPLEDKQWWAKFAKSLQKDIKTSAKKKKVSTHHWISEINCSQEDIGEPNYPLKKK